MEILFSAHSGVRYLVLFAGLIALLWFVWGAAARRPFDRAASVLFTIFVRVLDIQVLLGLVLLIGGRRPPGIWGHVALMLSAMVFVHVIEKRSKGKAGYGLPVLAVAGALSLILVGILSIGRAIL